MRMLTIGGSAFMNRKDQRGDSGRLVDRSGKPLRVLIVEDEALTAFDYAIMIQAAGGQILGTAPSAEIAEALAHSLRPDAIVMDVRLNGDRDGIEAAQAIKSFSTAGIVFVTGFAEAAIWERVRAFKCTMPLDKLTGHSTLVSALASLMI
jgi:two-component system, response regulator PdtaR